MISPKGPTLNERVLSDFSGRWHLTKEIAHASGEAARFEGVAVWEETGAGFCCHEEGHLILNAGPPIRAERRYLWQAPLRVCFEDGRFFHDVPALGGAAHHHCAPDDYHVTYTFSDWPRWRAVWRVSGPRKAYRMTADYWR